MKKTLILILLLLPVVAFAQVTISGRVLNQTDAKPIANASVFISNATTGSNTGAEGNFILKNIKPGKYEVVISAVGFESDTRPVNVTGTDINVGDIRLFVKTNALKEVVVTSKRDPDRQRNFELFKDQFLGTTDMAKECKIMNPERLDLSYDYKTGILTASSYDVLEIQNNALGYKLQYLLKNFTLDNSDPANRSFSYSGSVFFREMEGAPAQLKQWQENRQLAYQGSQTHFLQALLNNKLEEEGFRVLRLPVNMARPAEALIVSKINAFNIVKDDDKKYRDSLEHWQKLYKMPRFQQKLSTFPLTAQDLISTTKEKGIYSFGCNYDALFVTYNKYHRFPKSIPDKLSDLNNTDNTLLIFNQPSLQFDNNGSVINPAALVLDGVWLRPRIAGLLPLNYEPPKNEQLLAGQNMLQGLIEKLNAYQAGNTTEKAYLHLDKPFYAAGDTIYFKSYVTQGEKHVLSGISKVLNVDLTDPDGDLAASIKLNLNDGLAWGDFALPDSVKQGTYHLLAYTDHMLRESPDYIFNQSVTVLNTPEAVKTSTAIKRKISAKTAGPMAKAEATSFDVQFFAEGGNLLANTKTIIAIKAVNSTGAGMQVKGVVNDAKGHEVANFSTLHAGLGGFSLNAESGKIYTAKVTLPNGNVKEFVLPKADSKGYNLALDNSGDKEVKLLIKAGSDSPKDAFLVAQAGNTVYYSAAVHADKPVTIPKDKLPSGIVQFTLFTSSGEPVNERLAFVKPGDDLRLGLITAQQKYAPRQAVLINVKAGDKADAPVSGSFSMSVIDENKIAVDESAESTILTNLLLSSELKGYIEEPNYYFTNNTAEARNNLDLLMLTQGYRRFVWKQVLNGSPVAKALKPQMGLQVSGVLKDMKDNPIPGGKVRLVLRDKGILTLDTLTDAKGHFAFDNLAFTDTGRIVLQGYKPNGGRDIKFTLDSAAAPVQSFLSPVKTSFTGNETAYLQNSKQYHNELGRLGISRSVKMLNAVTIKEKKQVADELEYSENRNGKGVADYIVTSKQLESTATRSLYMALKARLSGLDFVNGQVFTKRAMHSVIGTSREEMLVVVDGNITGRGGNELSQIDVTNVEGVEVLLGPHFSSVYGPMAANGALIITLKRAKKGAYEKYAPGVFSYNIPGFYKAREFYSPQYDKPNVNKQIKDLRSTIYWNPNILTDAGGKASVSFFNADTPGSYLVILEGIDGNGNIGRQHYRYKVE